MTRFSTLTRGFLVALAAPEEIHQSQEKCPMWLDWLNLLDHLIWSVNLISLIWDQLALIWDQLDLIWDQLDLISLIRIKRPDGNLKRIFNPAAICTLVEDDRGTTHWSLQLFKWWWDWWAHAVEVGDFTWSWSQPDVISSWQRLIWSRSSQSDLISIDLTRTQREVEVEVSESWCGSEIWMQHHSREEEPSEGRCAWWEGTTNTSRDRRWAWTHNVEFDLN